MMNEPYSSLITYQQRPQFARQEDRAGDANEIARSRHGPGTAPGIGRSRADGTRQFAGYQLGDMLGRHATGIIRESSSEEVGKVGHQELEHAGQILVAIAGKDQQPPG